ncbi:erythromycin esterase-like enzyme [Saccharomonospora cyanea NA-134]|uniref:Erythromycin esterase-like enzyme n=2 Tax=Saccharomonospora cyanea TaxID=40989 RepID=H5XLT9_9PSEU|nr:erythromycin esterase-like enzyme [Saccharomonospora cyanea NA-134]
MRGTGVEELGLRSWLAANVRPFPLTGEATVAVPEVLARAEVVGLASAVRSARESVLATGVLLRGLVAEAGFRAVFIEGTEETGPALDRYVRTGEGDLRALVRASQSFLRTTDAEDVLRGIRSWNRSHPDDPVSLVSVQRPIEGDSLAGIEAALADTVLTWRAETGQRIVHWGGIAHLVVGDPRRIPPNHVGRSAGGALRARLGPGYAVAAFTTGCGAAPFPVPAPQPDFLESVFEGLPAGGDEGLLLDLHRAAEHAPDTVARWLRRPLRTRMIGPVYDPGRDQDFRVEAGPLADSLDAVVHLPRLTPTTPVT